MRPSSLESGHVGEKSSMASETDQTDNETENVGWSLRNNNSGAGAQKSVDDSWSSNDNNCTSTEVRT